MFNNRKLAELVELQREKIERLENGGNKFVTIRVPETEEQQSEYLNAVSLLSRNDWLLYHLVELWEKTTQKFIYDKGNAEYYRGYLACINRLISDGKAAKNEV